MAGRPKKEDGEVVEKVEDTVEEQVTAEEKPKSSSGKKEYWIRNEARRNQRVFGVTRRPVEFDDKGIAVVEPADYDHFGKVPGYTRL